MRPWSIRTAILTWRSSIQIARPSSNAPSTAGVVRCLIPALNRASALRAIGLAEKRPSVFVAVGLHPTEVDASASVEIEGLSELAAHDKVVAIGEIGLDYYWVQDEAERRSQRSCLTEQLDLAQRVRRPVVLHMREERDADGGPCAQDMLAILHDWSADLGSAARGSWRTAWRPAFFLGLD